MNTPVPLRQPNQYAAGYTLDVYCKYDHGYKQGYQQYYAQSFTQCAGMARKDGWKINTKTGLATCPKCAKLIGGKTNDI